MDELKNVKDGLDVTIQLPVAKEWINQATQDAYDKGYELGCWNIHVIHRGGPSMLEIRAEGQRENLEALNRHLSARWFAAPREDKHQADGQWITLDIVLKVGSLYGMPIHLTVGPKFLDLRLLLIGFEYGQTKPKSLLGGFVWNGNNKFMIGLNLCYVALEYMRIGRGKGDYYLY